MKLAQTVIILSAAALMAVGCAEKKTNKNNAAVNSGKTQKQAAPLTCEQINADIDGRKKTAVALEAKINEQAEAANKAPSKNEKLEALNEYQKSLILALNMTNAYLKDYPEATKSCKNKDKKEEKLDLKEHFDKATERKKQLEKQIPEVKSEMATLIKDGAELPKAPEAGASTPRPAAPAAGAADDAKKDDTKEAPAAKTVPMIRFPI